MDDQMMEVKLPRNALRSDDFELNSKGGLSINKERIGNLVKENIGKVPDSDLAAIKVTIGVSW